MSEVIYLEYNNESISNMLCGLFSDYGDIFGRLIQANLLNNQIRATLSMDANIAMTKESQEKCKVLLIKLMKHSLQTILQLCHFKRLHIRRTFNAKSS